MSDIDELRAIAGSLRRGRWLTRAEHEAIDKAADTITALRAEVEQLRGTLLRMRPDIYTIRYAVFWNEEYGRVVAGQCDAARRLAAEMDALTQTKDTTDEG